MPPLPSDAAPRPPKDFAPLLATKDPVLLVGGQAVNLWATIMFKYLALLLALGSSGALAAPEIIRSDARFMSYRRLVPAESPASNVPFEQKLIVRLLVSRLSKPVVPREVLDDDKIAEVVFRNNLVNHDPQFELEEFLAFWHSATLESAVGHGEISLAPNEAFLVLKDGSVIPIEMFGNEGVRLFGFFFRKKHGQPPEPTAPTSRGGQP